MPDTSLKKVAVLDANCYAGHSAAFHLAQTRQFTIQAIAEKFSKKSATKLNDLEVEPHIIDFKNVSVDEIYSIIQETEGLFLVFDIDQEPSEVKEFAGKLLQAIKKSRIRFLLFCGTISPLLQANIRAPRCENIALIELDVRRMPLAWTVLVQPLHYEALLKQMLPVKLGPDRFRINYPNQSCGIDSMALDDIGPIVVSIMKQFDSYKFMTIPLTSDKIYLRDIINTFNKIMPPKHFEGHELSFDEYEKLVSNIDKEWGNIFMSLAVADIERKKDVSLSLNPNMRSAHHWIVDNFKLFNKMFENS